MYFKKKRGKYSICHKSLHKWGIIGFSKLKELVTYRLIYTVYKIGFVDFVNVLNHHISNFKSITKVLSYMWYIKIYGLLMVKYQQFWKNTILLIGYLILMKNTCQNWSLFEWKILVTCTFLYWHKIGISDIMEEVRIGLKTLNQL